MVFALPLAGEIECMGRFKVNAVSQSPLDGPSDMWVLQDVIRIAVGSQSAVPANFLTVLRSMALHPDFAGVVADSLNVGRINVPQAGHAHGPVGVLTVLPASLSASADNLGKVYFFHR